MIAVWSIAGLLIAAILPGVLVALGDTAFYRSEAERNRSKGDEKAG